MRFLLLLSALLTAFAGSVSVARAGVGPACQVSALVGSVAARPQARAGAQRPSAELPSRRDVAQAGVAVISQPVPASPLYAGRLRT